MRNKIIMVICIAMMNLIAIFVHVILLLFSVIYFFGAIFWKHETFDKMIEDYYRRSEGIGKFIEDEKRT